MMIHITYAFKASGILNRHAAQLPPNPNASKSEAKFSPTLGSHDRTMRSGEWRIRWGTKRLSITSLPSSRKYLSNIANLQRGRLKRLHSSKCQQHTLNIQRRARHSGVLSCFASECKNNVKQQPALLLSNLWQVIEIQTSDSPVHG